MDNSFTFFVPSKSFIISLLMELRLVLPFILLAITARFLKKSWLAPGAFISLYWLIAIAAPLLFSPYNNVSLGAVSWIFVSTLTVLFGDLAGSIKRPKQQPDQRSLIFSTSQVTFISIIVISCTIIGISSFVIILKLAAHNLSNLLSIQKLLDIAQNIAAQKHTNTYKPFITQFLNSFIYAGPLFGGLLVAIERSRRHLIIGILSMFPALLMTVIFTLRGYILVATVLWISSFLAMQVLLGNDKIFTKRYLISGFIGIVLIFIIIIGAGIARFGIADIRNANRIESIRNEIIIISEGIARFGIDIRNANGIESIRNEKVYIDFNICAFGHMETFSNWFEKRALKIKKPTLGAYTFAGIFDRLGIRDRFHGLYNEYVVLTKGGKSNIYTVFRGLLEDFTPLGSIGLLFIIAFVTSRVYQRILQGKAGTMPLLAAFYATVLWSFSCSIWIWNSVIAAFILFYIGFLVVLYLDKLKIIPYSFLQRIINA